MATCGCTHMLTVTDNVSLWSLGNGRFGSLAHKEFIQKLVLMRVQYFGAAQKIISAAGELGPSTVVNQRGTIYTWGTASFPNNTPQVTILEGSRAYDSFLFMSFREQLLDCWGDWGFWRGGNLSSWKTESNRVFHLSSMMSVFRLSQGFITLGFV